MRNIFKTTIGLFLGLMAMAVTACGDDVEELGDLNDVKMSLDIEVSDIKLYSATVTVKIDNNLDRSLELYYSEKADFSEEKRASSVGSSYDDVCVFNLTELTPGTTYYLRAEKSATNYNGSLHFWDKCEAQTSFTTAEPTEFIALDITGERTGKTSYKITAVPAEGVKISGRIYYYDITTPDDTRYVVLSGTSDKRYAEMTNLTPEAVYGYYFLLNGSIIRDGEEESFSDLKVESADYLLSIGADEKEISLKTVVTPGIWCADISVEIATAGVTPSNNSCYVKYWPKGEPTNYKSTYINPSENGYSRTITGLKAGTEYEYQLTSVEVLVDYGDYTATETVESEVMSFKTAAAPAAPKVEYLQIRPNAADVKITLPDGVKFTSTSIYVYCDVRKDPSSNRKVFAVADDRKSASGTIAGLEPFTTYYLKAYSYDKLEVTSAAGTESFSLDDVALENDSFTTPALGSGQSLVNGYLAIAIDGCSVKWATANLDAETETDKGSFYFWGSTGSTSSSEVDKSATPDNIGGTRYDAVYKNMGSRWRMPTQAEWQELINNTTRKVETVRGVAGVRFTDKSGHSIFMPFTGMKLSYNSNILNANSGIYMWTSGKSDDKGVFFNINFGALDAVKFSAGLGMCTLRGVTE